MKYPRSLKTRKRELLTVGVICLLVYALLLLPREVFLFLSKEDHLFEYLTALFFLIISVSFFLLYANPGHFKYPAQRHYFPTRSSRYCFLLFGLVFFFGFGEEISWGQRIIGFSTPESIAERNVRDEFTIHNLELFSAHLEDGTKKGVIGQLFTMKQLFLYCFVLYLLIIPLLKRYNHKARELFRLFFIPIAHAGLGLLFIGNYAVYRILRFLTDNRLDDEMSTGLAEVQEFNFSLILLLLPFTWMKFSLSPSPMVKAPHENHRITDAHSLSKVLPDELSNITQKETGGQ